MSRDRMKLEPRLMPVNNRSLTGARGRVKCSSVTSLTKSAREMFYITFRIDDENGATIARAAGTDGVLNPL